MGLQSYKPYSRMVTVLSGLIIIIASLDASQVINLFPEYASQINTILVIAGLIAPAISQELRVVRAEDLIKEDYADEESEENQTPEDINITINLDGEVINDLEENDDVEVADEETDESGIA